MNYYHPQTLEHIRNPLPAVADWANATALPVPEYDLQTEQCMLVDGSWVVSLPELSDTTDLRIAEIRQLLSELDIKRIRPVAEGDTVYLATLNAQAVTLRTELQELL